MTLYSDSEYLVNAMTQGWVKRWKEKAANVDLWEKLLALCDVHRVEFVWVRGHAGNAGNEASDRLSFAALKRPDLPVDEGYVQRAADDKSSVKITREGQLCRRCAIPVVKRTPRKKPKPGQQCYFEYYLYCPQCHATYLVDDAKRRVEGSAAPTLL